MSRHLVDVNVLLALVWPRHTSHAAAHAWFAKAGHRAWATNPVVQLGLLRLLTNPAVTQGAVGGVTALELLREITSHPAHEFWPLDRELPPALAGIARKLRGHGQWTDALLLSQAAHRGGILVTFDSGLRDLAAGELSSHLLVLKGSA